MNDFRVERRVDRVPVEISVGMLRLLLGDQKVDEAYEDYEAGEPRDPGGFRSREEHRAFWVGAYLRAPVAMALGELHNRRTFDEVLA